MNRPRYCPSLIIQFNMLSTIIIIMVYINCWIVISGGPEILIKLEFRIFGFSGRRNPEINHGSRTKTRNRLNPHESASVGVKPGSQRWERQALIHHTSHAHNFLQQESDPFLKSPRKFLGPKKGNFKSP